MITFIFLVTAFQIIPLSLILSLSQSCSQSYSPSLYIYLSLYIQFIPISLYLSHSQYLCVYSSLPHSLSFCLCILSSLTCHLTSTYVQLVDCPPSPPTGYPIAYNMMNVLNNWNSDSTEIPKYHYDSLCHFDFQVSYFY